MKEPELPGMNTNPELQKIGWVLLAGFACGAVV
jgi:hypothetical protein